MEKVAYDLGIYVRQAKETLGYERKSYSWAGPTAGRCTCSTSHKPNTPRSPAAHLSRAETLTEWLDPSITNEADPDTHGPAFDIYAADCPNRPPFSADFVAAFRAQQSARNRRITHWIQDLLARLANRNDGEMRAWLRRSSNHV